MRLTVIIVNYNVKYYVEQCLNSLAKALNGIESEIYVVDNHSKDGSVDFLKERFPDINIIASNHNLGFARANNIAIRQSAGRYVLLLNPDTFVGEDSLRRALDFMDAHPEAGGAGVRMYNSDGTPAMESRRGLPTPMTSFYKMCGLCARFPESRRFGRYYMSYLGWDSPERIDVVSGAFCLLRREALDRIGLLDEDFFMYGEDIDLSFRLLKGGFENWYLPLPILHYKGESTHKTSFNYVHVFYRAMLIFLRKHYGHLSLWITIPIQFAVYASAFLALTRMTVDWMRKSLGFTDKHRTEPLYIFVGGERMISRCEDISRRNGLTAKFRKATSADECKQSLDEVKEGISEDTTAYTVLDTGRFGYAGMLDIMAHNPKRNVRLGTFDNGTGTVITPNDIIR